MNEDEENREHKI